jgi:hypothetical protein
MPERRPEETRREVHVRDVEDETGRTVTGEHDVRTQARQERRPDRPETDERLLMNETSRPELQPAG